MATYAIGDVQGCFSALRRLVEKIAFDPIRDKLWLVGDLVNRGPDSLAVLRYVKGLGQAAVTVLGNHDLHLLALSDGLTELRRKDTVQDVLKAPDRDDLLDWLRRQPLVHRAGDYLLVHAGLLPQWTSAHAVAMGKEVEKALRSPEYRTFLGGLYKPATYRWTDDLQGGARVWTIAAVLTRLRVCSPEGDMDLSYTGPPEDAPKGFLPWFEVPGRKSADATIICGHWAALGLQIKDNLLVLDAGCVWGKQLAAVRLEDREIFTVSC